MRLFQPKKISLVVRNMLTLEISRPALITIKILSWKRIRSNPTESTPRAKLAFLHFKTLGRASEKLWHFTGLINNADDVKWIFKVFLSTLFFPGEFGREYKRRREGLGENKSFSHHK
jgi:hypothetical protein